MKGDRRAEGRHRVCYVLDRLIWSFHVRAKRLLTLLGLRDKQSCKNCGRDQYVVWHITDSLWEATVPLGLQNRSVCIECFADFAHASDVKLSLDAFEILNFLR